MDNPNAWKSFFFYGDDIDQNIDDDIRTGLDQDKGALFFNQNYGAGIREIENRSGIAKEINIRFNIVDFFAYRNLSISDDKYHAITSNESIDIENKNGEMDITVNYYKADFTRKEITL